MYVTWTIATFAVAGYGLAVIPMQAMGAAFAFNLFETAGTVVWATMKHRLVPRSLQGRVSSLDWFVSIGLLPVSFALTGPVAAAIGARATLVGAGVLGGVVTLAFLYVPGMRDIERLGLLDRGPPDLEGAFTSMPEEGALSGAAGLRPPAQAVDREGT